MSRGMQASKAAARAARRIKPARAHRVWGSSRREQQQRGGGGRGAAGEAGGSSPGGRALAAGRPSDRLPACRVPAAGGTLQACAPRGTQRRSQQRAARVEGARVGRDAPGAAERAGGGATGRALSGGAEAVRCCYRWWCRCAGVRGIGDNGGPQQEAALEEVSWRLPETRVGPRSRSSQILLGFTHCAPGGRHLRWASADRPAVQRGAPTAAARRPHDRPLPVAAARISRRQQRPGPTAAACRWQAGRQALFCSLKLVREAGRACRRAEHTCSFRGDPNANRTSPPTASDAGGAALQARQREAGSCF